MGAAVVIMPPERWICLRLLLPLKQDAAGVERIAGHEVGLKAQVEQLVEELSSHAPGILTACGQTCHRNLVIA